jgi:hypothetical protein
MVPHELPRNHEEIIAAVPKAVAHLRAQLERKRLGLLFGSGISTDFDIPAWDDLVGLIANHRDVQGAWLLRKLDSEKAGRKSLASITQCMFGRYRERAAANISISTGQRKS